MNHLKDIPLTNFKIAFNEEIDKLRVCSSVGQLMEDIVEVESTLGKCLAKV